MECDLWHYYCHKKFSTKRLEKKILATVFTHIPTWEYTHTQEDYWIPTLHSFCLLCIAYVCILTYSSRLFWGCTFLTHSSQSHCIHISPAVSYLYYCSHLGQRRVVIVKNGKFIKQNSKFKTSFLPVLLKSNRNSQTQNCPTDPKPTQVSNPVL